MSDKEIVLKLLELAYMNSDGYAKPAEDIELGKLGAAAIAAWLEELGKIGLVGEVKPVFSGGGNFEFKLTDEALQIYKDKNKLHKKLSKILPDLLIEYDVFISYSSDDNESAEEISSRLETRGFKCFLAEAELEIGKRWMQSIYSAIKGSKIVIVLLTPRSINRPWVLIETGAAWALDKPLVPVLKFIEADKIVAPLKEYQARTIETSAQLDNVVEEIDKLIDKKKHENNKT